MNIGIYGGSFNPVHYGHIGLAKWIVENTDLDEVWLLVSPNNPLKPAGILADEQERLDGVRQAIDRLPISYRSRLHASNFEFGLPRPSYTANTLRELEKAYPEHQFSLVIGEDNLDIFDQWREHEWILEHFTIYVYPRHSESTEEEKGTFEGRERVIFLKGAPYFDISSSEIRKKQQKNAE